MMGTFARFLAEGKIAIQEELYRQMLKEILKM